MPRWSSIAGGIIGAVGVPALIAGLSILATDAKQANHHYGWGLVVASSICFVVGGLVFLWPYLKLIPRIRIRLADSMPNRSAPELVKGSAREAPILSAEAVGLDGFVHVRVTNPGSAEIFAAHVVGFGNIEEPQTQYAAKWRDSPDAEKRVFKDELLNLAQIIGPKEEWGADGYGQPTLTGKHDQQKGFRRGSFRLFSTTLPDGWEVHGRNLGDILDQMLGIIPPEEQDLKPFDQYIDLELRVSAASGQLSTIWMRLGFQRPKWSYTNKFWIHSLPTAEILPRAIVRPSTTEVTA